MRKSIFVALLFTLISIAAYAQAGSDTLKNAAGDRYVPMDPAAVDSLVRLRIAEERLQLLPLLKQEESGDRQLLVTGFTATGLLLLLILFATYRIRKGAGKASPSRMSAGDKSPGKVAGNTITETDRLKAEIMELTKENERLNAAIAGYNGLRQDYETLKHGIMTTYKVKHYPGYEKEMEDYLAFQGVFDTESSVANYAYQKFLKPVLAIADKNKNNPARVSDEERQKVLELLVSLSFLYIEYLYLRVGDLSVGGKMVERIKGFAKGNGLDPALMKQMNTSSGNRALVLRMILDRSDLHKLTYPVFDETNLNN